MLYQAVEYSSRSVLSVACKQHSGAMMLEIWMLEAMLVDSRGWKAGLAEVMPT